MIQRIVLRPKAQFGNILFQYAFAKHLSIQNGNPPIFIDRKFGGHILIELGLAKEWKNPSRLYQVLYNHRHIGDKLLNLWSKWTPFGYTLILQNESDKVLLPKLKRKVAIHGRLQDPQLWEKSKDQIQLIVRTAITTLAKVQFELQPGTLGIHVRRGDYMEQRYLESIGALSISFYDKAIKKVLASCKINKIHIYTDEPQHPDVLELMRLHNCTCISGDWLSDFTGLMNCEFNVISNSTFSWWAAFLSKGDASNQVWHPSPWTIAKAEETDGKLPACWNSLVSDWIEL